MAGDDRTRFFSMGRVEAYTDGVFAIAATLLVLDLTTSEFGRIDSDRDLWAALWELADNALAFAVSFALLSMLWIIHLRQFRELARADTVLLWLNSARLLFVVLIPFTTMLVADYQEFLAGRILLPIDFLFAVLFGHLSWRWAMARGRQLLRPDTAADVQRMNRSGWSAVICSLIAVAASPWVGSAGFLAFAFSPAIERMLRRVPSAEDRSRTRAP